MRISRAQPKLMPQMKLAGKVVRGHPAWKRELLLFYCSSVRLQLCSWHLEGWC